MSAEKVPAPVVFVWGQLIGSPSVGYTIVAHSRGIDAPQAETLRHRVMSQLRLPTNRAPGQVFALSADDSTVFFMEFETSAQPQSGGGDFTQEYYVVWDSKAFSDHGSRFWSASLPLGQVYATLHELAEADLFRTDTSDDSTLLWATLQSYRTLVYGILDSLVGQDSMVSVATSGDVAQDAAVLRAVHLLVPQSLRSRVGFVTNVTPTKEDPFRVCFCHASESGQNEIAFQPEPFAGYQIPGYASQIYMLCEACSDRAELARLIEVLSELPVHSGAQWRRLKDDLAAALWDRSAIGLVSKLSNSLGKLDCDLLIRALWSREDQPASRQAIVEQVAVWLGERATEEQILTNYIDHLADALQRSEQTADLALHVLPQYWRTQPNLVLDLCDALLRRHDASRRELWSGFILPLLEAMRFAHDEHVVRADTWLVSGTIQLDQFLQVCDANKPQSLYEIVSRLVRQGRIPNPDALRELSERHPSLVELSESVRYLEQDDTRNVVTELVAVSRSSRPGYERFVVLLVQLLLSKPSSTHLPRLIRVLASAVGMAGLPSLSRESVEQVLSMFLAISEQSEASETTRELLSLGQQFGVDEKEVLLSLTRSAQLRYFVDLFMYVPDCMLNRQKYLQAVAELLVVSETPIENLSKQELSILTSLYKNHAVWPVVKRLETEYQRRNAKPPTLEGHHALIAARSEHTALSLPCVSCGVELGEQDEYVLCPKCKRPYHTRCWIGVGQKCVKFGCRWRYSDLWERTTGKASR